MPQHDLVGQVAHHGLPYLGQEVALSGWQLAGQVPSLQLQGVADPGLHLFTALDLLDGGQ
ncbi:MAG: hypothetical protein OXI91_01155 [Chloroflexota bacterium]|nr:hypothetical protein [Chloroflexota bacterium]